MPAGTSGEPSPRELKMAKQKLLAEFELTGNTTISIGGREMSKNDVLKMMDSLDYSQELNFHILVASDPILLHFLSTYELSVGEQFSIPEGQLTPEFIAWLSPYFSWAFAKAALQMFRKVKPEDFETLIVTAWYMTDKDEWEAWNALETYLEQMLKQIQSIARAKSHTPAQVAQYAGYNFIWLLCNLPEDRFEFLINNYAFAIMQLAVKEFNNKRRDSAFELMGYAKSLHVNEETMRTLNAKEREMQNILDAKNKNDARSSGWFVIRIVLAVAYILHQVSSCN